MTTTPTITVDQIVEYVSLEPDGPCWLVGDVEMSETRRLRGVVTRPDQGRLTVAESEIRGTRAGDESGHHIADSTITLDYRTPEYDDGDEPLTLYLLPGEARSLAALLVRAAERVELAEEVQR